MQRGAFGSKFRCREMEMLSAHCLSGVPRFNKKVQAQIQCFYFGFCFPFPKTLMFKSFSRIFEKIAFFHFKKAHFQTVGQNQLF